MQSLRLLAVLQFTQSPAAEQFFILLAVSQSFRFLKLRPISHLRSTLQSSHSPAIEDIFGLPST